MCLAKDVTLYEPAKRLSPNFLSLSLVLPQFNYTLVYVFVQDSLSQFGTVTGNRYPHVNE